METHVRVVGILNIVLGALGIAVGLVFLLIFGGIAGIVAANEPDAQPAIPILGAIGAFIFLFVAVLSIPGIITGIGLLKYKDWARILGIVLSALNLLNIPFGTILGVYGLWVLLQNQTVQLFQQRRAAVGYYR